MIVALLQEVIGSPTVRQDQGSRHDGLPEPGLQFLAGDVLQGLHLHEEDALDVLGIRLNGHNEGCLSFGPAPPLSFVALAAHVGVVHLDAP